MMQVIRFIANALVLFVVLPVVIVALLGMVFSPLQANAHALQEQIVLEANDLPLEEAMPHANG